MLPGNHSIERGVIGKDTWLKALCWEWCHCIEQYGRQWDDTAFGHNERPLVGTLAGAAWRRGMVALQDVVDDKKAKDDRRKSSMGYADLWIADLKRELVIECKTRTQGITRSNSRTEDSISAHWDWALDDADRHYYKDRAGCLIVRVNLACESAKKRERKTSLNSFVTARCEDFLRTLHTSIDRNKGRTMMAWCFPTELRTYRDGKHFWPGAAMLLGRI